MTETVLAAIAGGIAGFVSGSLISGGRRIFGTYALLLIAMIVEATPRRFLPNRLVWWYNDALMAWTPTK